MTTRTITNRIKKQGMPPGSLVNLGEAKNPQLKIDLVDYTPENLVLKENTSFEECLKFLSQPTCTWVNIRGLSEPKLVERLGAALDLHPLILEDILNPSQRSKVDEYKNHIFIVMRLLTYKDEKHTIDDEQISIIINKNYVVTISEKEHPLFDPLMPRLTLETSRIRRNGIDYLAYAIIDAIVDYYFVILQEIDERLDSLETDVIKSSRTNIVSAIQNVKKDISHIQKVIWPLREVITELMRDDSHIFTDNTKVFLHDVYDHVIQAVETLDTFRDISFGMIDLYMSKNTQHLNETMKVLTVVSTVFVPLTFLASLYGMNFKYIPGMDTVWGFFVLMTLMLSITVGMVLFFRRRHWI